MANKHVAPDAPETLQDRFRDAIAPRTLALGLGVLLPNGAGTEAIRRIVYFDGHGITHPIVVLACWIVGGVLVTLLGAAALHRRTDAT